MIISNLHKAFAVSAIAALGLAPAAYADEDAVLIVNEELELVTRTAAPEHMDLDEVISGWVFRSSETQALQMDDFENPGMIQVESGLEAWDTVEGSEGKSCASCHGDIETSMQGVRAEMPKYNDAAQDLWSLENYINFCREERMGAEPLGWDSTEMVNMTAAISLQSRGMPVAVKIDGPAEIYWEQGKELYYTRNGQLELSCANCHEDNYGNNIRADHLSQGQINGFPTYRLKTTKLGSIHNRFKGCIRDTRAETYKSGSAEFRALELYVASRGLGLSIEGVSVRN